MYLRTLRPAVLISAIAAIAVVGAACSVSNASSNSPKAGGGTASGVTATIAINGYHGPESKLPQHYPALPAGTTKPFTIGFLNPVGGNENLMAMQDAAQAEVTKLGGKMIAKDAENDISTQLRQFNELLTQGVNAIVVYPLDPKALAPSLAVAKEKGIPVIGYDVTNSAGEALPDGYTSQILQGRDWQAWLMAKAMADAKPGGQVGLIGISIPVPGLKYLMQRVSYWAEQMGLHIAGEVDNTQGDSAPGGQAAATALLGAHTKLDGIIAFNDPSAVGAASAAKIAGRDIAIIGNNGDSNGLHGVKSGELFATFQNDAVGQGVQGVVAAYDVLDRQQIPQTIIRPPLVAITSANVATVQSWTQQLATLG